MFVNGIEVAAQFTRPLHFISRNYGSQGVTPGAATLFIVNEDGWALTCRHVAQLLIAAEQVNQKYQSFRTELKAGPAGKGERAWRKKIEKKYGYRSDVVIELKYRFVNCADHSTGIDYKLHPDFDVALIRFKGYSQLLCSAFPVFAANGAALKQGKSLCRLGFPFPEFDDFAYDSTADSIDWTASGRHDTPRFPIEGMLTRHLVQNGSVWGFEMSTPGLRGQSGGPAFDTQGVVWGMQAQTNHLDLNFDIDQEVMRNGAMKRVKDHAFLNVGHCIHVDVLKQFMRDQSVNFQEA